MKIRVGTFNIQHGLEYLKAKAECVENINLPLMAQGINEMQLDICGLNEVRNQENVPGLVNQAKYIGDILQFTSVFGKAIDHAGGEYGNAIVSKYPILSSQIFPIAIPENDRLEGLHYEDRVLLGAKIQITPTCTLNVFTCHFGLHPDEEAKAIEVISQTIPEVQGPTILMGDFNSTPDSHYIAKIRSLLNDTEPYIQGDTLTFPSDEPFEKIDYIFTSSDISVTYAEVPNIQYSDHRPLFADILIDEKATR